jgi:hypothetical protein
MKKYLLGVILTNLSVFCFGQQNLGDSIISPGLSTQPALTVTDSCELVEIPGVTHPGTDSLFAKAENSFQGNLPELSLEIPMPGFAFYDEKIDAEIFRTNIENEFMKHKNKPDFTYQTNMSKNLSFTDDNFFEKNRRNIYSSMWAFASLNYLYCDLVAFMDKDLHSQYHTGTVDGMKITPGFLTGAALMMQISIANVFLPQIIKNDNTLRWVQIASGITMTLIQSATLFAGKPTPYYATFSALEIGATTFITINALKWKPKSRKQLP